MDLQQIKKTHDHSDCRVVDVKPILGIVEDIFNHFGRVTPGDHENVCGGDFDGDSRMPEVDILLIIQKVTSEIRCKCSGDDGDTFTSITTSILKMLTKYSWESKVAICLAAVAIAYGEFGLVVHMYHEHGIAKSVAVLKQLTELIDDEQCYTMKSCFKSIKGLNFAMWDVTVKMLEILEYTNKHPEIMCEKPHVSRAVHDHIPNAAYYIIRSVVACAKAVSISYEHFLLISEKVDFSYFAGHLVRIREELDVQIKHCKLYIEEKKRRETYDILVCLFKSAHLDCIKFIKQLICVREDILVKGCSKVTVTVDVFKKKNVVLLITDLNVSHEELRSIEHMYMHSRKSHESYEILWIPIISKTTITWTKEHYHKFEELRRVISFHTLCDPQLLAAASIMFIREKWQFSTKTILVALDSRVKTVCSHALHMFLIWGFKAFPFTVTKEEVLWKEVSLKLDLFVSSTEIRFREWIKEDRYICMYGGDNLDWIKQFTSVAKHVASVANIKLELVYIGKRHSNERVRKITTIIESEKLSHTWCDVTQVSYFWTKLESVLYSKHRYVKDVALAIDPIIDAVTALISFDSKGEEWATIWHGSEMARAHGNIILQSFEIFEEWKENAISEGFIEALKEQIKQLHTPQHCSRVILSGFEGVLPDKMVCFECNKPMEKYFMYRCCTD